METHDKVSCMVGAFSFLMREILNSNFKFNHSQHTMKYVEACIDKLEKVFGELGRERIVDYCVCQIYNLSNYSSNALQKWSVNNSFGQKSIERFCKETKQIRFYEDKFLKSYKLSRLTILNHIRDRKDHPLYPYIYPSYEDHTKNRLLNNEAGYLICQQSTLLWTPFSPVCRSCDFAPRCKDVAILKFPELIRIRTEEFQHEKK